MSEEKKRRTMPNAKIRKNIPRACIVKLEYASLLISEVAEHYRWDETEYHFDEIQDLIGYLIEFIAPDLPSLPTFNDKIVAVERMRKDEK